VIVHIEVSVRRDSRSQETVRVITRKVHRRHMTGDHDGRTASRAALLVTAADEILGTHNVAEAVDVPWGRRILAAGGCASSSRDPACCLYTVRSPGEPGEWRSEPCPGALVRACSPG
jgi:hypothetical protein